MFEAMAAPSLHSFMSRATETQPHSWLEHLPPYQAPRSVDARCLQPCPAAALNQAPPCTVVHQHSKSPLYQYSHSPSQARPHPCAPTPSMPPPSSTSTPSALPGHICPPPSSRTTPSSFPAAPSGHSQHAFTTISTR